jgi:hypothetical protein
MCLCTYVSLCGSKKMLIGPNHVIPIFSFGLRARRWTIRNDEREWVSKQCDIMKLSVIFYMIELIT